MNITRIESAFNKLKSEQPYWGDVIIFNTCITGKGYGKMQLGKAFKKLVSKDDYEIEEIDEILEFAFSLASEKQPKTVNLTQ